MPKIITDIVSKLSRNNTASNLLKAGAVATTTLVTTALIKPDKTEDKTLDYMASMPNSLSAKAKVFRTEKSDSIDEVADFIERGETATIDRAEHMKYLEEMLKRAERIRKSKIDSNIGCDIDSYLDKIKFRCGKEIESREALNKKLEKIKNPKIKKITKELYKKGILYDTSLEILTDIDNGSKNIKNTHLLGVLNKRYDAFLEECKDKYFNEFDVDNHLEVLSGIVDTYNNIKGNYVQYQNISLSCDGAASYEQCKTQEYLKDAEKSFSDGKDFFEKNLKKVFDGKRVNSTLIADFLRTQKTESFEKVRDEKALNILYNIYLKDLGLSQSLQNKCKQIQKEFGVMVLLSSDSKRLKSELDYIYMELKSWHIASKGKANFPKILNLEKTLVDFLHDVGGANFPTKRTIQLNGGDMKTLEYALRHELMHSNDRYAFSFTRCDDETLELYESIMPTIYVDGQKDRDWDNCKYKEELLNAGINPQHIDYAYSDRDEFLAVAAEGDHTVYSQEFKDALIKLGMPEWFFDIEINSFETICNRERVKSVREENPDVTDYDELVEIVEEEALKEKEMEFLLKTLFGAKGL